MHLCQRVTGRAGRPEVRHPEGGVGREQPEQLTAGEPGGTEHRDPHRDDSVMPDNYALFA